MGQKTNSVIRLRDHLNLSSVRFKASCRRNVFFFLPQRRVSMDEHGDFQSGRILPLRKSETQSQALPRLQMCPFRKSAGSFAQGEPGRLLRESGFPCPSVTALEQVLMLPGTFVGERPAIYLPLFLSTMNSACPRIPAPHPPPGPNLAGPYEISQRERQDLRRSPTSPHTLGTQARYLKTIRSRASSVSTLVP